MNTKVGSRALFNILISVLICQNSCNISTCISLTFDLLFSCMSSCPVDQTVIFHDLTPNYVSLNAEGANVKRFSFEVHWTQETFNLKTYISCKLSLCSRDYSQADEEKGIPVVSSKLATYTFARVSSRCIVVEA